MTENEAKLIQHQKNVRRLQHLTAITKAIPMSSFVEFVRAQRTSQEALRQLSIKNTNLYNLTVKYYDELTSLYQMGTCPRSGYHINHIKNEHLVLHEVHLLNSMITKYFKEECKQDKKLIQVDKNKIKWITK